MFLFDCLCGNLEKFGVGGVQVQRQDGEVCDWKMLGGVALNAK